MDNYVVKTDGRPLREVEAKLRKYLPGLDARLFPISVSQAIVRGALLHALESEYPDIGSGPLLQIIGIAEMRAVGDDETLALLTARDPALLPPRPRVTAAKAAGVDWHLDMVKAPQAWALLGGPDAIAWGDTRIGQIDTGYTEHPALGFPAATWFDVARARSFMPPGADGPTPIAQPEAGPGMDNLSGVSRGHGTRIGATISGCAPDAPGGVYYGVAPKVPHVPVRITDVVLINHAERQFAQALNYVVDEAGVSVVNVSLGIVFATTIGEMRAALSMAYERGVIVVCAAGNYVNSVVSPAKLRRTIAVGGVTRASAPWSGSSFGPEVDFSAPAADLRRANTDDNGRFDYRAGGDGTSYATAITTGAAALWLTHRRADIAASYAEPWQRVAAFTALAKACTVVPDVWQPGSFGSGILDIEQLLKAPLPAAASLVKDSTV